MKKTENKSLTVRKDKLEEINRLMNELNIDGFTTFTNITYDFFIKYHDKIEGDKKIDKGGRGFELVSSEQRKVEWYKLPTKSTKYSAGYDFYLPETIMLEPGETKLVFSNAKAYMNEGEVLKLYIRSSIGVKKGIVLANGTGIIDCVPKGTQIRTLYSTKNVEDLNINDKIISFNTKTFKKEEDVVIDKWIVEDLELIEIETEIGSIKIPLTKQVFTRRGYIFAYDLKITDEILSW